VTRVVHHRKWRCVHSNPVNFYLGNTGIPIQCSHKGNGFALIRFTARCAASGICVSHIFRYNSHALGLRCKPGTGYDQRSFKCISHRPYVPNTEITMRWNDFITDVFSWNALETSLALSISCGRLTLPPER